MMMSKAICVGILLSIVFVSCIKAQQDDFPVLKGPYLGQQPPGTMPEVFGPRIISVDENFEHSAAVFSLDGKEVFWCTNVDFYTDRRVVGNLRLYYMKVVDGKWTAPRIAPFAKDIRVERPVFSPDGSRLYFESFAAPDNMDDMDIFVVERQGDGWSEPEKVSSLINTPAIERMHCFTADGSFYFSRSPFTGNEEMFVSQSVDGKFSEPEKLGKEYNSDVSEFAIVFGPNEDYMLINQRAGRASSNVFISYKNADGTWSERIKTPYYSGGFLALSPDGKYLFMLGEAIYWVSTSFVEEFIP
jgi:Tol biopolymer transport system component